MLRLPLIALLCAAALIAVGCGDKQSHVTFAADEGTVVEVGGLSYQVQMSRYLNPNDLEDRYYLRGLPAGTQLDPGENEVWFAVFMRVKNNSGETLTPTTQFTISDTQNNKFQPLPVDEKSNPFLYVADPILHAGVLPEPETPSANGPIQGSLILFRLKTTSLQNRPLVMHVDGPAGESATIDLDL